jgi:hypothetical protein
MYRLAKEFRLAKEINSQGVPIKNALPEQHLWETAESPMGRRSGATVVRRCFCNKHSSERK